MFSTRWIRGDCDNVTDRYVIQMDYDIF